ncbi:MAG: hypothetical protein PF482_14940, partial [Desulfobacteraceae bacterium]|nr:hypothetical protein [Desulfobacteraceae bacterium]
AISLSTGDYYRSFLTPRNDNHDFEVFVPALFMSTIVQNGRYGRIGNRFFSKILINRDNFKRELLA